MRKFAMLPLAFATAALLTLPVQAAQTAKPAQTKTQQTTTQTAKTDVQTFTGWITDNCDGLHGASVDNTKAKVQGCKERGGRVVFYNLANKKFYDVDKIDLALDHVGHPVVITGVRDWNLIKVETIVPKPS